MWNATPPDAPWWPRAANESGWVGPALFPAPLLAGVTAACAALLAVGTAGNALTVLAAWRFRELRTATNLQLCSLAAADLLVLLGMPLDLARLWHFRPWRLGASACKLFQFVGEACTYAAALTVTALSAQRYCAICRPLRARALLTRGRAKGLLLAVWALAASGAAPVLLLVGVEHEPGADPRATAECRATDFAVRSGLLRAMLWVSSAFFFLPLLCLSVLYALVGRTLWRRRRGRAGAALRGRGHGHTVGMLAVVVFAFILCWLPFHVGRYLFFKSFEPGSLEIAQISQYCNLVSFVLFYLSAAINPILYNIMSKRYRVAVLRLLGFEPFTPRKLSTMKDETSPAWTESSMNT
ncbi:growth hormone secretagogue receptor type 1 [Erinaceus europaeus]|uniref:Growth hormone secretagogue receptor type 1 n=1 Tax=Erinaceus europaeus TaxID=9365 RepID=A0A1S2ZF73_ERIEU|nr:growth hormone secretagogue receptor type 1 [Erinaceus europaeus]